MVYTVSDIAKITGVSKVSIYNKLKLKEMEHFTHKNKGITYISEDGFNFIKDNLRMNNEVTTNLNSGESDDDITAENKEFKEGLNIENDYMKSLKSENEKLWLQIEEKDKQISDLISRIEQMSKLVENSQVLLREKEEMEPLNMEEHFQELNKKIEDVKSSMDKRKESGKSNSFWDKFKTRRD